MATQTVPTTARRMARATARFLDSLLPEQRARIEYHYLDVERVYWIHRPQNRHGLPIQGHERRRSGAWPLPSWRAA